MTYNFEVDDKTRTILDNKMAFALIRMLYVRNLISNKEYNNILKLSKSHL